MSAFQRRPTQFELFPQPQDGQTEARPRTFFVGKLNLSVDNVVMLTIAVVVVMVVSFSLGIEKGKQGRERSLPFQPRGGSALASVPARSMPEDVLPEDVKLSDINGLEVDSSGPVSLARPADAPGTPDALAHGDAGEEKVVDKFYTIQVASFKKRTMAQKEAMQLQDKGYDIMVVPKGQYSIVCVGKFPFKEDAKVVSEELKKKYKDCLIRRL